MIRSEYTANLQLSASVQPPKVVCGTLATEPKVLYANARPAKAVYWEQPYIPTATRLEQRRKDIAWANRTKNRFNKSAAFKALNSLGKLIKKGLI